MAAKNKIPRVSENGLIRRLSDGGHEAYSWETFDLSGKGAEAVSRDGDKTLWRKRFTKKRIYLPREKKLAFDSHLFHVPDPFIISMNGFSMISEATRKRYGADEGAYEAACEALLIKIIKHILKKFEGVNVILTDGAAEMGVDLAILNTADRLGMQTLGFSCPGFMMYVKDDTRAVYVAESKNAYAESYIQPLHLLITTGGRAHALQHDVFAACVYGVRIHFVDMLSAVAQVPVPATVDQEDGSRKVENACAAFGSYISFSASKVVQSDNTPPGGDWFDALVADVQSVATEVCRSRVSVGRRFQS